MTEKEKMLGGKLYDTSDKELRKISLNAHTLCTKYNRTPSVKDRKRAAILDKLFPDKKKNCYLEGPIYIDYGVNTHIGENFYANFNFTVLDSAEIKIGDNVMMGPNCTLVAPVHPFLPSERNVRFKEDGSSYNLEFSKPIEIGDDCWLASNVTVIGGVKIGKGCVIGAGSVVTKDIPDYSLAVGKPCKVLRKSTDADKMM